MRTAWLSQLPFFLIMIPVVPFLEAEHPQSAMWGWLLLILPIPGIFVLSRSFRFGSIAAERPTQLGEYVRGYFSLRQGLILSIILFGFTVVFISGSPWSYIVGLAVAFPFYLANAPTSGWLDRIQAKVNDGGGRVDVREALLAPIAVQPRRGFRTGRSKPGAAS
ncbi:MAG: hypothetical protein M3P11_08205 [Actinomycetota bacterium]|nr:hypothetical protein [Actinomycetota bacterium]